MEGLTLTEKERADLTELLNEYQLNFPKNLHFYYFIDGEELKFERIRKGRWRNADYDLTLTIPT